MTSPDERDPAAEATPAVGLRVPRFGAGATGLVSLFLAASVTVVPFLGVFVAPLGLIPVLHFQSSGTSGIRAWGWVVLVLIAALGLPLGSYPLEILTAYILIVALPAASVEAWARWTWSEGRWVGVAVGLALVFVLAAISIATIPEGPTEGLIDWYRAQTAFVIETYHSAGVSTAEMELAFDTVEEYTPVLVPGFLVIYVVMILFWIRPRIPVLGYRMAVSPFEQYRGDEWLAAGFAVAGLGTLLLHGIARWVAVNLLVAVLVLYFVQGLAMIRAHLARWVGRGWFVRWGVALLCIYPPIPILVATLGVADSFFPLRPTASDDGGNP